MILEELERRACIAQIVVAGENGDEESSALNVQAARLRKTVNKASRCVFPHPTHQ